MSSSFSDRGIPTHQEFVAPLLQALKELGGSAKVGELTDRIQANFPGGDELAEIMYENNPDKSVFLDRIAWSRSTSKRIGATEQPSRGLYLITDLGESLLQLPTSEAIQRIKELDRIATREKRKQRDQSTINEGETSQTSDVRVTPVARLGESINDAVEPTNQSEEESIKEIEEDEEDQDWKDRLLRRLHKLTPEGFEKFVIFLLKRYDLKLTHTGKSNDEGIDAIGTAPLSPVLSSRVAVQVKRYDPNGKRIGRETVALFQRDAQTKGAERAILVTLSQFTESARRAAIVATPTVDLINGDNLADLILQAGDAGVTLQPTVDDDWFNKFD